MDFGALLSGFLGAAVGGCFTTYASHFLTQRRAQRERHDAQLTERLKESKAAVDVWDGYWNRPSEGLDEPEMEELHAALTVFGSKFAEEGIGMFFNQQAEGAGLKYRARMLSRLADIERMLGYPQLPDLGEVPR